ncbi:ABC transporter ATP-binding protein arb1 [Sorochytrium milnesiophthora]
MPPKVRKNAGKKAAAAAGSASNSTSSSANTSVNSLANQLAGVEIQTQRSCTGVLTSHVDSRDIRIESFTMNFHGVPLIQDSTIELNYGRRYGLIGENGSGKSTFLKALAARDVEFPRHIDVYLLDSEYPPTDLSSLEAVIQDAQHEIARLEAEMETLLAENPDSPRLEHIYQRLEELDPNTFESSAASILYGLGFDATRMKYKTRDLSGGWRMRVALAKALFIKPTLLLLDQPTNHLDLGACVWLEQYLARYDRCLLIISHSQDFLNNVCTNIIWLNYHRRLEYYGGNYDTFVKTRAENEVNQMKAYEKQQAEIAHIKQFIASCGTFANLVRQAKSRQKILDKMEADGLIQKVEKGKQFEFQFLDCGKLPPPVLSFSDVAFSYSGKRADALYENLDMAIDCDSRIALVGPNGAGKSTLLKLMIGDLSPIDGTVSRHSALKICRYSQHAADQLSLEDSAIDHLKRQFPDQPQDLQFWRSQIGRFGLTGNKQLCPIEQLSDGEKARIVFCQLAMSRPHIILLDEPTNAADMETIDSLANAIKRFEGGVVVVSHDFRLLSQVAETILVCDNKTVTPWNGTIQSYKEKLSKDVMKPKIM